MPRALITGVSGFAGGALAIHLAARGWSLVGSHGGHRPLPHAPARAGVRTVTHDLTDADHTVALLRDAEPDFIFHLAGQSRADFPALLASHVTAAANILAAARDLGRDPVILIPGSSAQFGDLPEHRQPITEATEYRPATLYGIAKAAEARTAAHFHREYGSRVVRTHTFNCIGPGQRPDFVPATFARQIAAIEKGAAEPVLHVGNLDARRDTTDIRDVAEAYVLAATRGRPGEVYNICNGTAVTIGSLVEQLRAISRVDFEIRRDPTRLQSADVPVQRGDASKLQRDTGWRPAVLLEHTLADVLEEWRAIV